MQRVVLSLCLLLMWSVGAGANNAVNNHFERYIAGKDYRVLQSPVETEANKDQVEVTEIFWYGWSSLLPALKLL